MGKWTQFMDMHSGGCQKLDWAYIYIEAPWEEAKVIFYNRFKRNPERVTCTCCGDDYSISESDSLREATAYERNCAYGYSNEAGEEVPKEKAWVSGVGLLKGCTEGYVERVRPGFEALGLIPLKEYLKDKSAHFIYSKDIAPEERNGSIPEEGYVWVD